MRKFLGLKVVMKMVGYLRLLKEESLFQLYGIFYILLIFYFEFRNLLLKFNYFFMKKDNCKKYYFVNLYLSFFRK